MATIDATKIKDIFVGVVNIQEFSSPNVAKGGNEGDEVKFEIGYDAFSVMALHVVSLSEKYTVVFRDATGDVSTVPSIDEFFRQNDVNKGYHSDLNTPVTVKVEGGFIYARIKNDDAAIDTGTVYWRFDLLGRR